MRLDTFIDASKASFGCTVTKNNLELYAVKLDHLMWACPDLDEGVAEIATLTGVTAEFSGSHRGLGTRNALLSLGDRFYLEIIAPDPAQPLEGNFGGRLQQLKSSGLLAFAMMESSLSDLRDKFRRAGLKAGEPARTERETADGNLLVWELLFLAGIPRAPFYIDWLDCVHPARTSPTGCKLSSFHVATPEPEVYKKLVAGEDLDSVIHLAQAETIGLSAILDSPNGVVSLDPLAESVALF